MKVEVKFVVDADRPAGPSMVGPPPNESVGKEVVIMRRLINFHGYWAIFEGKRYVYAHAELDQPKCNCADCRQVRSLKKEVN